MEKILSCDTALFRMINAVSHPALDGIMYFVSLLGELGAIIWIVCIALVIFDRKTGKEAALWTIVAVLISDQVIGHFLRSVVPRPRPFMHLEGVRTLGHQWLTGSFPSGHASSTFAAALILSYFYPRLALPAFTFAVMTFFSRVYCGMHHPSDVLFGALAGLLTAGSLIPFIKRSEGTLIRALPFYTFAMAVMIMSTWLKLPQYFCLPAGAVLGGAAALSMAMLNRRQTAAASPSIQSSPPQE